MELQKIYEKSNLTQDELKNPDFSAQFDYAMVFPLLTEGDPTSQSNVCKHVCQELIYAGFELFPYLSIQKDELMVLLKIPNTTLAAFTDRINFKVLMSQEQVKLDLIRGIKDSNGEYIIRPRNINEDTSITPISPYSFIYGKYESHSIDLYDTKNHDSPLYGQIRLTLIYYLLKGAKLYGGCGLDLNGMIVKGDLLAFFALHNRTESAIIYTKSLDWGTFSWDQPFEHIKDYFGEKIALFYHFLGHYSYWLIIPAAIGFIFQLIVWGTGNYSHPVVAFYSVFIACWAVLMLEFWKRKESGIAMEWGMSDFESQELDRPEFIGNLQLSYIDGSKHLYYSPFEARNRLAESYSVVGVFIMLVVASVVAIYLLRYELLFTSVAGSASAIASILNTIVIMLFNYAYSEVALKLTVAENHRTDTEFEDSLILKQFLFTFVNSYISFFYLAFIALYLAAPAGTPDDYMGQCGAPTCMEPLSINLAIIFGTRIFLGTALSIIIPYAQSELKKKEETLDKNTGLPMNDLSLFTPAENAYMLMVYNPTLEAIALYSDVVVQFGYLALFVTALPIAPFFTLIVNYISSKVLTWKLLVLYQRPIPVGAQDIGVWQEIMQTIATIAILTNGALICYTMDVLDNYTAHTRAWIYIVFMWTLGLLQQGIGFAVPDVPFEVQTQLKRQEFIVSKLIDHLPDEYEEEIELVEVLEGGESTNTSTELSRKSAARKRHSSVGLQGAGDDNVDDCNDNCQKNCMKKVAGSRIHKHKKIDHSKIKTIPVLSYPVSGESASCVSKYAMPAEMRTHKSVLTRKSVAEDTGRRSSAATIVNESIVPFADLNQASGTARRASAISFSDKITLNPITAVYGKEEEGGDE